MTLTTSTQTTILIIDDDAAIGRSVKRLSEQAFPGFQVIWVKNGVTGIELARQYADQLRLVVLDVKMNLLDGTLAAVQLRRAVPHVPITEVIWSKCGFCGSKTAGVAPARQPSPCSPSSLSHYSP